MNNDEKKEYLNKYELPNNKSKGVSVTKRINDVNQPGRGYLNPNLFIVEEYESNNELSDSNAFSPNLIGLAVDYLTRFMLEKDPIKAFDISLQGAEIVNEIELANYLIAKIKGLDDLSIDSAVKLCGFDCAYRVGWSSYKPVDEIFPGRVVINDIREMVNRSLKFFEKNGPIIKFGFTFDGGYTSKIGYGDGDFMTNDTLWDFKTIKGKITIKHTLQLLIYYIMGLHSKYPEYKNIKYIGIFNPKLNKSYKYPVSELSDDLINIIEKEVIGY